MFGADLSFNEEAETLQYGSRLTRAVRLNVRYGMARHRLRRDCQGNEEKKETEDGSCITQICASRGEHTHAALNCDGARVFAPCYRSPWELDSGSDSEYYKLSLHYAGAVTVRGRTQNHASSSRVRHFMCKQGPEVESQAGKLQQACYFAPCATS